VWPTGFGGSVVEIVSSFADILNYYAALALDIIPTTKSWLQIGT
jgi:hypothetical protein